MSLPPAVPGLSLTDPRCADVLNALCDATDCPPAGVNEADQPGSSEASGQRVGTLDVVDALSTVAGVVGGVVLATQLLLS